MERFTVSIDDALAQAFNGWLKERGYANRSEGFRDLLRAQRERKRQATGRSRHCVASLSYVYNHHERDLAGRLAALQHAHHPLVITSTHVHLDHEQCLETLMLRGPTAEVQAFSEALCAHRGVRHTAINVTKPGVYTLHAAGRGPDDAALQQALGLARQAAWLAVGLAAVVLATRAAWPGLAP